MRRSVRRSLLDRASRLRWGLRPEFSFECVREPAMTDGLGNETMPGASNGTYGSVSQVVERYEAGLVLLLGFGCFSVLLALTYKLIRRHVFNDVNNLDTTFDAGGRVTTSLTAVTVGVQLLWPADLLQSATVTAKLGVAGAFWYSTAVVVNILLFPLLSVHFKTRAPGAKTFLQVIKARHGPVTHAVFCCLALLTNIVILTAIIISGFDLFKCLIQDVSDELCMLIMATLFGSYSFVGGLGSTFYVSYFNALTVFAILATFVARIFYLEMPFGDLRSVYETVQRLQGPEGNEDRSYITFWSAGALYWMVQGTFIAASVTFCDQASWQSRIAAKPMQGVLGFFGATFLWFAVPSTIGTTTGMIYLSYSADNITRSLSTSDIDAGLVTPYVAQLAMGKEGAFMVLIMFTMLMMSTGSGEVMAISSIIVYDIYQSHIRPFRQRHSTGHCILCGKVKKEEAAEETTHNHKHTLLDQDICRCPFVKDCMQCTEDLRAREMVTSQKSKHLLRNKCSIHGGYRTYQDGLVQFKSWCILFVSMAIVPFGLLVVFSRIDLNWVFLTGCVITIPCFPGVTLCITWVKTTARGLIIGSVSGLVSGVSTTLLMASRLPGGLDNFLENTSEIFTVMVGSCMSFFVTLTVTIVVSLLTHNIRDEDDARLEWQKVRDIDNPLNPWVLFYRQEFSHLSGNRKPSYELLATVFRKAKVAAIVGCTCCLVLFVLLIPGVMATLRVLSWPQFRTWVTSMHVWCFAMAVLVIVVTPVEEICSIWKEWRMKKKSDVFESECGQPLTALS